MTTTCAACGGSNPEGKRFCGECGSALNVACPSCGAANPPSNRFCNDCGTALADSLPSQSPVRPVTDAQPEQRAERRLVSVLFADLVGFTTLAEGRDAEETREFLSRYFDLCRAVIGQYGGVVEKFIGDAVMAVWGAPVAHEDDGERSVRAALELVDAVQRLDARAPARAAIATGEAAVTVGATGQGMVAGDLVNTASRLQSIAPVGAVLVNEATYRAASKAIAFESVGEQELKGKALPVPAWRAQRVVAEVGGRNRRETFEPPFVGRDDELRLLKDLFHVTGRERRSRLVSITGSAGIGKSRLAWELEKYVDGLVAPTYWHRGRSPAYGEGLTFWSLGEMIRGRAGLLETDDEATTRAAISRTVDEWIADKSERAWIERALLALLGLESGISHEQLFGAWRTLFERMSDRGTVVLVFEDLHWADSGTFDFLEHLLEWSRLVPLFIVTLARPELLSRRPDWGAGRRSLTSLYLDALPEPAMRALLAGLVVGLPEPAIRAVIARAEGVPLYAVETVRMLVADGRLERTPDGAFVPVGDVTDIAVPETLTALIAARLDALEAAERALILDASVLGLSFTPAALAAITQVPAQELEPRLRSLVRLELLEHQVDPRSPEMGQYAFVQALIREVAYNTIARKDRKVRHLAAARFFEALDNDELAGALAGHYIAARENASDRAERDALAAQARVALRGAAQRAADLGSHDQAIAYLEQALELTSEARDRADLLERAGESAAIAARYDDSARYFGRAVELYRELGDRPRTARATAAYGRGLLYGFRSEEALALLEDASREFSDISLDPAVIALDGQLARAHMLRSDPARSIEVSEAVLQRAEHASLLPIVADTFVTRGTALVATGRVIEGTALMRLGGEIAEANGLTTTMLRALLNRSETESQTDPRSGLVTATEGLELARRLGDRRFSSELVGHAASAAIRMGEWDRAVADIDAILAEELDAADRTYPLAIGIEVAAARGDDFSAAVDELERVGRSETDPQVLWGVDTARAWTAVACGRLDEAGDRWAAAAQKTIGGRAPASMRWAMRAALWDRDLARVTSRFDEFEALGAHGPALEVLRDTIRAGLHALGGEEGEAVRGYSAALRRWRELGLPWDLALTAIDIVTVLDNELPVVREAADAARPILERLGATVMLERLDASDSRATARVGGPLVPET